MTRRYLTVFLCMAAGLLTWFFLPDQLSDRAFFTLTARTFANPPFFVTGGGGPETPYVLRTLSVTPEQPSEFPPDVTITDDPENVFQASPPSPIDFAIILKNIRRLGRDSVAISVPLAWTDPDTIALMALDLQLDSFPHMITAAPLSRNPVPSPAPPAFRRSAIPLVEIHGDTSALPIVNHVPIPDVVLGNRTSLAAFTRLESEPESPHPHLLARWEGEDFAVPSFYLLAALNHFQVPPGEITVRLGEYISMGKNGPYIPVDGFGRLTFDPVGSDSADPIPAQVLIDAPDEFLGNKRSSPVIIRNALSAVDPATAQFSESLVQTVATLSDPGSSSRASTFERVGKIPELLYIASLISLIFGFGNYPRLGGRLPLLAVAVLLLVSHFILASFAGVWPPTGALLVGILPGLLLAGGNTGSKTSQQNVIEEAEPLVEATKTLEPLAKDPAEFPVSESPPAPEPPPEPGSPSRKAAPETARHTLPDKPVEPAAATEPIKPAVQKTEEPSRPTNKTAAKKATAKKTTTGKKPARKRSAEKVP